MAFYFGIEATLPVVLRLQSLLMFYFVLTGLMRNVVTNKTVHD